MAELLTAREVAEELKLFLPSGEPNERLVQIMAGRGEIVGVKVSRWWRFRRGDIDAYLDQQASPNPWKRSRQAEIPRRRSQ